MKKSELKAQFVWQPPVLNDQGAEVVSPISLVAVADLRPVSMAERVRRYMRLPQFVEDQKALADLWADSDLDENLDPDEVPIGTYEDRAREIAAKTQARRAKEAAEASQRKAEEDRAQFEAWSLKYEELRQKGAGSPPSTTTPESSADAGPTT